MNQITVHLIKKKRTYHQGSKFICNLVKHQYHFLCEEQQFKAAKHKLIMPGSLCPGEASPHARKEIPPGPILQDRGVPCSYLDST